MSLGYDLKYSNVIEYKLHILRTRNCLYEHLCIPLNNLQYHTISHLYLKCRGKRKKFQKIAQFWASKLYSFFYRHSYFWDKLITVWIVLLGHSYFLNVNSYFESLCKKWLINVRVTQFYVYLKNKCWQKNIMISASEIQLLLYFEEMT